MEKIRKCWTLHQLSLVWSLFFWQYTFPKQEYHFRGPYKPSTVLFSKYLMYSLVCTPFSTVCVSRFVGFLPNHKKSRPKHLLGFLRSGLWYTASLCTLILELDECIMGSIITTPQRTIHWNIFLWVLLKLLYSKYFPIYVQNKQQHDYFLFSIVLFSECRCAWKSQSISKYYKNFENYN